MFHTRIPYLIVLQLEVGQVDVRLEHFSEGSSTLGIHLVIDQV
jgi:hypothetical protein